MNNTIKTPILATILLHALAFTACDHPASEPESTRAAEPSHAGGHVSGDDARRLIAEEHAVLVDVRTPGEFSEGHVEGAINIPVQQLDGRMSELARDQPVIVYCQSGGRSGTAASELREAGYTVHDLGPMSAWGG